MRFWDASAIVPLLVTEPGTPLVQDWFSKDPEIVTWLWTRVELVAAAERYVRDRHLPASDRRLLLREIDGLAAATHEVVDALAVRSRAVPLLGRHQLRAADAGQLGAALLVSEGQPSSLAFVCLDRNLAEAAEREGFPVLTWPEP